jgi:hypothetical protein
VYLSLTGTFLHVTGLHSIGNNARKKLSVLCLDIFFRRTANLICTGMCGEGDKLAHYIFYSSIKVPLKQNKEKYEIIVSALNQIIVIFLKHQVFL